MSGHDSAPAATGQFEFAVTTDPQQVIDYLHHRNDLPPAREQKLEEQAQRQELVIWHVRQRPGWSGQEGQTYTMDNGLDQYQFAIQSGGLDFGVFAEKATTGFSFSADTNPGKAKMVGTWYTPAGQTRFDMQPGQSMMVRVK